MGKGIAIAFLAVCFFAAAFADPACKEGLEEDTDRVGGDLTDIDNGVDNLKPDAVECCEKCTKTPGCVAITWDKVSMACWLKGPDFAPPTPSSGLISKQVIPDECFGDFEEKTDRPGGDLVGVPNGAEIPKERVELCCKKCKKTEGCKAFSWNKVNKYCSLKGPDIPAAVANDDYKSKAFA